MAKRKSVFLHSPELERFSYPDTSPFKTNRAGLTRKTVYNMGLLSGEGRSEIAPVKATRVDLEQFHKPYYLDAIMAAEKGDLTPAAFAMGLGTADCPVFKGMYDYAALASGSTITGARLILSGEADIAFNPSGGFHHAFQDRAAGFCYVNDIVLGALVLAEAGRRVAFLDLDVHHCDGVQAAFYDRPDILTLSLHETGRSLFPGTGFENDTGVGAGIGFSVNIPLPVGTYDAAYKTAFSEVAMPLLKAYNPDVLMIELGMDTLAGDPMAHFHLTNNVIADILEELVNLNKPILATGGGGYNVENTVRAWALLWSTMCGEHTEDLSIGMGGVMLASTEWAGGLRDRVLLTDAGRRGDVDTEVRRVIAEIQSKVFPLYGLK
ncbi:MAG: acetoin utilization protein AcuC [bacterium]